jgi:hypothetical protein
MIQHAWDKSLQAALRRSSTARAVIDSAPRVLVHIASLAALGAAFGACVVPQTRYDEALSAARVEQAAHRHTGERLYAIEQQLMAAEAALRERAQKLQSQDELIAAAQLDARVADKERQSATDLVEQLRGELARVGDHLGVFAGQKAQLTADLEAAVGRAERLAAAERLITATRDLSLLLAEPITTGEIELIVRDGRPLLMLDSAALIGESQPSELGGRVLTAAGRIAELNRDVRFEIAEQDPPEGSDRAARLRRLSEALTARGVAPERIIMKLPDSPASSPTPSPSPSNGQSTSAEPRITIALDVK